MNDNSNHHETLSPQDAVELDSLLDASGSDAPSSPERKERVQAWLNLLGAAPAPAAPADLAARTLAAVRNAAELDRMKIPVAAARSDIYAGAARRRRSRQLAVIGSMAVAASLFLVVIIMGVDQAHKSQARVACDYNLRQWSAAFAAYASDNSNQLPALATPANHNWLHSSTGPRTNAANLLPLLNAKLIGTTNLYCPGNLSANASPIPAAGNDLPDLGYSYACLYGSARPTWRNPSTIVMADRNPLFLPDSPTPAAAADRNSRNHDRAGNYLLHGDGSVTWATSPNAGPANDNIWTVDKTAGVSSRATGSAGPSSMASDRVTVYTGTETPASLADAFVCP